MIVLLHVAACHYLINLWSTALLKRKKYNYFGKQYFSQLDSPIPTGRCLFVAYQVGAILKASADIGNEELTPSGIAKMEWYSKIFQL
jgi:hypothetical protein